MTTPPVLHLWRSDYNPSKYNYTGGAVKQAAAIELTAGSKQTKINRYENSYNYFTFRRKGIS